MPSAAQQSFLFLQGPLSPLYARIADRLEAAGARVCRINLCVGDALHWRRAGGIAYRGRPADWPAFVARIISDRQVTDVVMHSADRPYHAAAANAARAAGARVIVTELGYLRPDWMTLELDGTAATSHFPRTPDAIRALAACCPEPDLTPRYKAHFIHVALPDVIYNLSSTALWFLHPHYRRHTIYFPPIEYLAWLGRLATAHRRERAAAVDIAAATASGVPLFVLPLQLEGDFQIRAHAPFAGQAAALEHILASFVQHAPRAARLLVKTHPLDNGLESWSRVIRDAAARHGATSRVHILDGGKLSSLWPHAAGVVTINSSAGLEAILAGVPVKPLGRAIYDVAGLTHQGRLDGFWRAPSRPDAGLARDFVRALAGTVQVRGTLYSRDGLDAAVANISARILAADFLARAGIGDSAALAEQPQHGAAQRLGARRFHA